jgi:hypothetical protein
MASLLPLSLLGVVLVATPSNRPENLPSSSAEEARTLAARLERRQLQTFAARVPETANRYVAAMKAGPLLLVVEAAYAQPALLNEQLWRGDFDAVYRTLNTGGERAGKLFIQDMGADGLHATRAESGAFDVVFEAVVTRFAFDGDWKAQGRTRDEYGRAFAELDRRYAGLLRTLIAALDGAASTTTARQ